MKLTGKWRILLKGDAAHFRMMPWNRSGLGYLLSRLAAGEEVDDGALDAYGITAQHLPDDAEIITPPSQTALE
jgi:hypothetical protein